MEKQEESVSKLKEIGKIDFDRSATIWMLLLSSFLFILGLIFLIIINGSNEFRFSGFEFISSILIIMFTFLIIQFGVIVIHEYLHGIGVKLFKRKPIFGFMVLHKILPVAYTHTKGTFTKKQFNIILLLPLVVITTAGFVLSSLSYILHFDLLFYILFFSTIINLSGCTGDLYTAFLLYQYPSNILIDNRELTDPLFILSDNEYIKENRNSRVSIVVKGFVTWVLLAFLLEITFSVTVTFLLMLVAPLLHVLNIVTLDLIFWEIISSNGFSVHTKRPYSILILSVIVAFLICIKYRGLFTTKDEEKIRSDKEKQPKTNFIA